MAVSGSTGTANLQLPGGFKGEFFTQVLVIDFGVVSPLKLTVSNGLKTTTGEQCQ